MKKFIMAAIASLMLMSSPAYAQNTLEKAMSEHSTVYKGRTVYCDSVSVVDYTFDDISAISRQCSAPASEKVTPETIRQWGSLGKEFSSAVVETAAGLGTTANAFLTTPLGILIAFYFLWGKIGGIIIGIPLLICVISAGINSCRFLTTNRTYKYVPAFWGLFNVKVVDTVTPKLVEEGAAWLVFLIGAGTLISSIVILSTLIF